MNVAIWIGLTILLSLITYNTTRFFTKEVISICLSYNIRKRNHQKIAIPQLGGLALALTTIFHLFIIYLILYSFMDITIEHEMLVIIRMMVVSILGYGLLGLFEDIGGKHDLIKGLHQHWTHFCNGRVSAIGINRIFGVVIAFFTASFLAKSLLECILFMTMIVGYVNIWNIIDDKLGLPVKISILHNIIMFIAFGVQLLWIISIPILVAKFTFLSFEIKDKVLLGNIGKSILASISALQLIYLSPSTTANISISILLIIIGTILILYRNRTSFKSKTQSIVSNNRQ
jgi:hypothetical protein